MVIFLFFRRTWFLLALKKGTIHPMPHTVDHRFKVTISGNVADLEWMVFISEFNGKNEDDMEIISGRWPPDISGMTSRCKPCQVKVNSVKNLSEFRLFS